MERWRLNVGPGLVHRIRLGPDLNAYVGIWLDFDSVGRRNVVLLQVTCREKSGQAILKKYPVITKLSTLPILVLEHTG